MSVRFLDQIKNPLTQQLGSSKRDKCEEKYISVHSNIKIHERFHEKGKGIYFLLFLGFPVDQESMISRHYNL